MVHALEKTGQLLDRCGVVIEAHDLVEPRRIEVHTPGRVTPAGRLLDHSNFEELRRTNAALDVVVHNGLFKIEEDSFFEYRFHAASLAAFHEWLEEQWDSTYFPDHYAQIVRDKMSDAPGDAQVIIRANARMVRMRLCT
jgi:hypothetical protein